jgi:hypothetical protein
MDGRLKLPRKRAQIQGRRKYESRIFLTLFRTGGPRFPRRIQGGPLSIPTGYAQITARLVQDDLWVG